jgi:Na+/H+ antiporter NhaD/arsenite permease-like protein
VKGGSACERKMMKKLGMPVGAAASALLLLLLGCNTANAAPATSLPSVGGIPVDFILFGLTLLGVALFHHHTLRVALIGLVTITLYKLIFTGFESGPGVAGLTRHLEHEWVILTNLFCLLTGFALLSRHFEKSHVPVILPKYLPNDWKGGFILLLMVFVLSGFLDNIAAALIGGAMAHQLFRARVHIGYLAAVVVASNAGGAGSVVGDTTTTMMWLAGISPLDVVEAYAPALVATLLVGYFAARKQQAYSPIIKNSHLHTKMDSRRVIIVILILVAAIATNMTVNLTAPAAGEHFPCIGVAVWLAILVTVPLRRPDWEVLPEAARGTVFLLSLVLCASLMPVQDLPIASSSTALGLGFVSAIFDNIPLTALAIHQGGYDWGFLAYAVGFGGSMVWFGSSAGVALSNMYPEAKSVGLWLRHGWMIAVAYVVGFVVLLEVLGWHPHEQHTPLTKPASIGTAAPAAAP